jgi:galactose mutarotase-like enzyme
MIEIGSGALRAAISPKGAELQSLTDVQGREYMSSGDPAFWRGRAPLLFPVIGRLNNDVLRLDGTEYRLEKHGFARRSTFDVVTHKADRVLFRLTDSETTRALYPFAFALDAEFRLSGATLHMTVTVSNTGDAPLPFSFGYHPAFAWPLPGGAPRVDHAITFKRPEPARLARVTPEGLIVADAKPSPVEGTRFTLADALFEDDALVWTGVNSRHLSYGAPGGAAMDITFPDTENLGIWTKPGAAFVCIEPWAGHADPEGYTGDFRDKPGVMLLPPQGARSFRMDVTIRAAD